MKRFLFTFILSLIGLILVTACASNNATVLSEPGIEASPTPHITSDGVNLSLVGNTGRPQFIYAFAKW